MPNTLVLRLLPVLLLTLPVHLAGCSDSDGDAGDGGMPSDAATGDAGDGDGNAGDGDGDGDGDGAMDTDSDGDGLSDADELALGTDPNDADSDDDGLTDGEEVALGTDPLDSDSDDDGFTDGEEVALGTDPRSDADETCGATEAVATEGSRPVDIIVIVDNSSSMDGEIAAIEDRINQDFAAILDAAGVDWQVILLSRHGAVGHDINGCDDNGICIEGELAGNQGACDPQAAPAHNGRFKQYSICINSRDGLAKAAASFDDSPPGWAGGFQENIYFADGTQNGATNPGTAPTGWFAWLRAGALRTFLMISDDESDYAYTDFTDWMYSKDPSFFGTAQAPNWNFHSIIAVQANQPATDPWLPGDPVLDMDCGQGSAAIGYDYQDLSIGSGGLRFPICENGNFDSVFQAIAQTVVESSSVPCILAPQLDPAAGMANFDNTVVIYESGAGMRAALSAVADAMACGDGDYFVRDERIELCPDQCAAIESDDAAVVRVRIACDPVCGNGKLEPGEACDDGNLDDGDACSAKCKQVEGCGNGVVDGAEECDDGNASPGDGCSAACDVESGCGDGHVDDGEECDDDNLKSGDGCDDACQVESGCGDGIVQAGESCDDGNLTRGDGCDDACFIEVL